MVQSFQRARVITSGSQKQERALPGIPCPGKSKSNCSPAAPPPERRSLLRPPDAFSHKRLTSRQKLGLIHCEHVNRCSTDCRQSDDNSPIELKVFDPDIQARVKEPHDIIGSSVAACDIRTLVAVTVKATEGPVIGIRSSTVLPRNDVIDLKRKPVARKWNPAILTSILRTSSDLLSERRIHCGDGVPSCALR